VLTLGKTGDQLLKRGFVPSATFAFAAKTRFEGRVSLQNVECQPTKNGTDLRAVPFPNATGIFGKSYIEHMVLDLPMKMGARTRASLSF